MKRKTLYFTCIIISSLLFLGAEDGTVYVTNSGKRYHREDCRFLSRSKIPVTLEDALYSGYEPCTACNPPARSAGSSAPPDPRKPVRSRELYRANQVNPAKTGDVQISQMLPAEVVGHIDGDTVRVRIRNPPPDINTVETIRMIGVDTPETVHPNRPVEHFGREAGDFTKERLLGKQVYLAFDWDLRDRYGRLLAYIYTGDGLCFNAALIHEGYGYAYSSYVFQFKDEFEALERLAMQAERGLWRGMDRRRDR